MSLNQLSLEVFVEKRSLCSVLLPITMFGSNREPWPAVRLFWWECAKTQALPPRSHRMRKQVWCWLWTVWTLTLTTGAPRPVCRVPFLLASSVNTPIDQNVLHYLRTQVTRWSLSCMCERGLSSLEFVLSFCVQHFQNLGFGVPCKLEKRICFCMILREFYEPKKITRQSGIYKNDLLLRQNCNRN